MHATTSPSVSEPTGQTARLVRRRLDAAMKRGAWLATTLVLLTASPAAWASDDLDLMPDFVVTAILLAVFVALVFPLNSLIFQPLFRVMDERSEKIEGARARARQVEAQASEALERYEDAIRGAREEAVGRRRENLEAARADLLQTTRTAKQEAERELVRAREELDGSIEGARAAMRTSTEDLAHLSAERVLGRSLS